MKLLAAISHHGLGHLAQSAPVLNALRRKLPQLSLTVWSGLGEDRLASRIRGPFSHRQEAADVGLAMDDALRVDSAGSFQALARLHEDWPARLRREAAWVKAEGFGAVFSDVAYLPLGAARLAGLPSLGLCSLNWRDITAACLPTLTAGGEILADMESAYQDATIFLRPAPSMPMAWLGNAEDIPPVAGNGRDRRVELASHTSQMAREITVLVGFGGIAYPWAPPILPGVAWLVPGDELPGRPDVHALTTLGFDFLDALASSDVLLTKVGYGSFVEAAVRSVPVLYLDRPGWPETPYLSAWLQRHGNALAIGESDLQPDRLAGLLRQVLGFPPRPPVIAEGAEIAARRLVDLLA